MNKVKEFLRRKNIVFSVKRYFIDAMGAMAQGLFCTLLVGTILNTLGTQLHIGFLSNPVVSAGGTAYTIGGMASAMVGPAMAVAIANGAKAAITGADWAGLILVSFVLPAILTWLFAIPLRKWGWIKDGDLKLNL